MKSTDKRFNFSMKNKLKNEKDPARFDLLQKQVAQWTAWNEDRDVNAEQYDYRDRTFNNGRFRSALEKLAAEVRPQLVLISAGFDSHRADPIGSLGLEVEDFAELTQIVSGFGSASACRPIPESK